MSGILNIGEMGALALHAMLEVAKRQRAGEENWLATGELADALQASRHTLHKVVKLLVQGGLLDSSRGPTGGIKLSIKPEDVRILDIIQAVEGDIGAGGCLFMRRVCHPVALCQFCGITQDLEKLVRNYFIETTLADLLDRLVPDAPVEQTLKRTREATPK